MGLKESLPKIRVANVIEEGKLGGPQVRIASVSRVLGERVETTVVMPNENSVVFRNRCDVLGVKFKTFWMSRITKEWKVALRYILFTPFEVLRLAIYFKNEGFDLIHASGGSWQYKAIIAAKLAGIKVLWHLNDTSMPWVFQQLFVFFSRFVDGYIFASERSKQYYDSLIEDKKPEFIIPAPVDTSNFDPSLHYDSDETLIQAWEGKVVIGTVANINPIKGLEVFIKAAAEVSHRVDNLFFVVVGPVYSNQRDYCNHLHDLCTKYSLTNIDFVGSKTDVRSLLERFDIYICSSNAESSPISVWEAMAMEKAIISTDVGDVPLYVTDGINGIVINVGDSNELADKMALLILSDSMRFDFGRKARDVAVQKLDLQKCANLHYDAYRTILQN